MALIKPSLFLNSLIILLILSILLLSTTNNQVHAIEKDDILCLKSIKDSVEDPHNFLGSWKFSSQTKKTPGFICSFSGVECWNALENRVIALNLGSFGLKGSFPNGVSYCNSLQGLDLSRNHFSGLIPANISSLPYLVTLSLSSNAFSGEIPASLGNLGYLNALELDRNRLSGRIPQEIGFLRRIQKFTVADNLLVGPVPRFVNGVRFNASSYANNSGLCGYPLKPCN